MSLHFLVLLLCLLCCGNGANLSREVLDSMGNAPKAANISTLPHDLSIYFKESFIPSRNKIDILKEKKKTIFNSPQYSFEKIEANRVKVINVEEEYIWIGIGKQDKLSVLLKIQILDFKKTSSLFNYKVNVQDGYGFPGDIPFLDQYKGKTELELKTYGAVDVLEISGFYQDDSKDADLIEVVKVHAIGNSQTTSSNSMNFIYFLFSTLPLIGYISLLLQIGIKEDGFGYVKILTKQDIDEISFSYLSGI